MLNVTWPASRLGEAMEALSRHNGPKIPIPPQSGEWIESTASWFGLEAEACEMAYREIEEQLRTAAPALVKLPDRTFLVLIENGFVLGPDLKRRRLNPTMIRGALCARQETQAAIEIDALLAGESISAGARSALIRERLGAIRISGCWRLRERPAASFWRLMRQARLPHRLIALAAAHLAEYALWVVSWWVIGQAALAGSPDRGWLLAWVLLLLTLVPLRAVTTWLQGRVAILGGGLLKERLLYGVLRLEQDEIRHQGAGQLLGRVMESEAMESLALNGGFLAFISALELIVAAAVLAAGAGGAVHAALLVVWVALAALLGWRYLRRNRLWAEERLRITNDLVERLVGHRTRLAQEPPERWHEQEDLGIERYLNASGAMDRAAVLLMALVPRGWLIVGILGLAGPFISGAGSPAALAIGIGGVLLAFRSLKRLSAGFWNLVGAVTAWRQIAPLFHAAARPEVQTSPDVFAACTNPSEALIEAHDVVFRYGDRARPVIQDCSLQVRTGERLLLEGPSGGGKSTLGSLIAGLRCPESGLLLARGLDRHTLGPQAWRRMVAAAPQFHENHVLTGSLAFNLLMGRRGILGDQDLREAEIICQELGLKDLLERMPAGLFQMVGETGWQLSHGERSRLYIARTLLQRASMIVLDESFAALDPENLRRALQCVLNRAETLLVIAHP